MKQFRDTDYYISKDGKVYRDGNEKKPYITKVGYKQIQLHIFGSRKSFYIHRMLAELYIPNPDNKPKVNHKDLNKLNNNLNNLEWCTQKENMNHYFLSIKKV